MKKAFIISLFCCLSISLWALDPVVPGVTLTSYYASIDGKQGNDIRVALESIISAGYTQVSYSNIGYLLKYADTEEADGTSIIDVYSSCTATTEGETITWGTSCSGSAATNVGCESRLNREHSLPQSWFAQASPMVSDAFHIYAVDAVSNGHRSDNPYGECAAGVSYTGANCNETGRLGTSTFPGYESVGKVYEPADEFKGDLARGYFYMLTRYRTISFNQAVGSTDEVCFRYANGQCELTDYMLALLLKWHRQDPVSRKEKIRNEAIYGNSAYHRGNTTTYAQHNRNPFIDYPELIEYIWGNKQSQTVNLAALTSAYDANGGYYNFVTECPTTIYNVWFYDNVQSTAAYPQRMQLTIDDVLTFPTLQDREVTVEEKTSGTCEQRHYHFMGWVSTADRNAPTDLNIIPGGTTTIAPSEAASAYFAVWAREE